MSRAALSSFVFGIYLVVTGLGLLVMPLVIMDLLAVPVADESWIRIVGVLVVIIGYLYIRAGLAEVRWFYQWSIHTRLIVVILFTVLVLLNLAPWQLVIFVTVDLLAALWTIIALLADERKRHPAHGEIES